MQVTIDIDKGLRIHMTPQLVTLVAHTDGAPYRIEPYSMTAFLPLIKQLQLTRTCALPKGE